MNRVHRINGDGRRAGLAREPIPIIGEEATDTQTGRSVWWDGTGWSYKKPRPTNGRSHDQDHRSRDKTQLPLTSRVRPPRIPLSFAQQRLWFLEQMNENTAEYHMPEAL